MVDHAALAQAFTRFAHIITSDYEIGDLLHQLSDQVVDVLGITATGLSVAHPAGKLCPLTATHDLAVRVEECQAQTRQGPGHDAYQTGKPVLVPDLDTVDSWPAYTPAALEAGCKAVAGLPIRIQETRIGALTLYADHSFSWADDDVQVAQLLADMATGYIVNAAKPRQAQQLAEQLQQALHSRLVIEQAKGILAERQDIDIAAAFEVLRGYARSNHSRLHVAAQAVIAGTGRP
jgi:GAF domain-containing protein